MLQGADLGCLTDTHMQSLGQIQELVCHGYWTHILVFICG